MRRSWCGFRGKGSFQLSFSFQLLKYCGGDGGLAVAQAAVTGADLAVLEDLKAFRLKAGAEQAGEAAIRHATAAERNCIQASLNARVDDRIEEPFGNARVKSRRNTWRRDSSPEVVEYGLPHLSCSHHGYAA